MKRSTLPFVVQEHHEGGVCHWDLMLHRPVEADDADSRVLATWSLAVQPVGETLNRPILAKALPDHRRAYLTYEGPIHNGERGRCHIVDRGTFVLSEQSEGNWRIVLDGEHLQGRFVLRKHSVSGEWVLAKGASNE